MDAGGGVGLIKGRKFSHVIVIRPRFRAGSIKFAGNKTWASDKFNFAISSRNPSGQSSESPASGAEISAWFIGMGGAIGETGTTGFGAPLPLLPLFCGAATLIVGVVGRMQADEATGVTIRDGGAGICNGGVGIRNGGVGGAAGGFIGVVDIVIPCPRAPNGLPISSVNSTCFCVTRRASNAGFRRVRISLSGSITGLWSCSPPELTNTPGAACRNSPKVIFTAPRASWVRTFSSGMAMTIPAGGVCMTFARNSIDIEAIMGCRGNCSSLAFSVGGGVLGPPLAVAQRQPAHPSPARHWRWNIAVFQARSLRCYPRGAADPGATRKSLFLRFLT